MTDYTPIQEKALKFFTDALMRADKAQHVFEAAKAEHDEAQAEISWVSMHPALTGLDLAAIVADVRGQLAEQDKNVAAPKKAAASTSSTEEKPKRRRRTKAEMEAARAAEAAAKAGNPPANESDDAAQAVEGQGLGTGVVAEAAAEPQVTALEDAQGEGKPEEEDDVFSEVETEEAAEPEPARPAVSLVNPFAQGAAPTAPVTAFTNPFAQQG